MAEHDFSEGALIGPSGSDHVRIIVRPPFNGEGWADAEIEVRNGGFWGHFGTMLLRSDLENFRTGLRALAETLAGEAAFEATEGTVSIVLAGNGRGEVLVGGSLTDDPGSRRSLQVEFAIDQTFLPGILRAISGVLA